MENTHPTYSAINSWQDPWRSLRKGTISYSEGQKRFKLGLNLMNIAIHAMQRYQTTEVTFHFINHKRPFLSSSNMDLLSVTGMIMMMIDLKLMAVIWWWKEPAEVIIQLLHWNKASPSPWLYDTILPSCFLFTSYCPPFLCFHWRLSLWFDEA